MGYQPGWVDGQQVGTGIRDCAGRYDAIAAALGDRRGFRALDFGAHAGYFSLRLADEFDANVTAVDDYRGLRVALAGTRVTGVHHRLTPAELDSFGDFEVGLCLSVLHHIPDWRAVLDVLLARCEWLFLETPAPHEVLPKAVAHSPELAEHIASLGGEVIARTPGYRSRKIRPLYLIRTNADIGDTAES